MATLAQVEAAICPAPFFRFQGFCRVQKNEYPESVVIDTVPGVHLFVISEQDIQIMAMNDRPPEIINSK